MVTKNKYMVYIDSDYILKLSKQSGCDTMEEQRKCFIREAEKVRKFLSGDDGYNALCTSTFIGTDGKRHYGIEIKAVPGFGRHSGRVLRKIKKLRK